MKKILAIFAVAGLSLIPYFGGGKAFAQRCLPGMSSVEVTANMVDGFYTGFSRDCGYSLGVGFERFTTHTNTWSFSVDYLQSYKPYATNGRIPVAQLTGSVGYNLHLISDYSQTFHLWGGVSAQAGYETVNWGERRLADGSTLNNGDAFIYGGAVTLKAKFYLSDNFALGAQVQERCVFGNSTGHFKFCYGLNASYTF